MKTSKSTGNFPKEALATQSAIGRGRGRPKDLHLQRRILQGARDLFLEHGFQVVSMDAIALAAEVSNRTVYSHFESKERLLGAVFTMEAERLRPRFSNDPVTNTKDFRLGLVRFGEMFVGLLTNRTIQGLGRILVSEATRYPELVREFYDWGPRETQEHLAAFLESGKKHGWLQCGDAQEASQHLLALWLGTWHFQQQLGLTPSLRRAKIKMHVKKSLQVFLHGVS